MHATAALLLSAAVAIGGYLLARNFVRRRLRFVDAIHSAWAPWVAGVAGAVVFSPVTLLPLLGTGTAVLFGLGVGFGTASGARFVRRGEVLSRRLIP